MSNRLEKGAFWFFAFAAIVVDAVSFYSRCDVSPGVNISTFSLGLFIQGVCISAPLFVDHFYPSLALAKRRKLFYLSLLLFLSSVLVVRYSVLYSDAIGQPNGFKSKGLQCRNDT
jgi:hypothetical protein